jgi:hypothetical protein
MTAASWWRQAAAAGYTRAMQLRIARLCLDCEEIHAAQQCPICASDEYAWITRWVPAPERRMRPRRTPSADATAAKTAVAVQKSPAAPRHHLLTRGIVGITAVGLAGWILRARKPGATPASEASSAQSSSDRT